MAANKSNQEYVKVDVKQEVTDRIIAAMESGPLTWHKSWATSGGVPRNATTDASYSGVNRVLLLLEGRSDPRWVTYKQAEASGWQVRKGEKGCGIVKVVEAKKTEQAADGTEETRNIPVLKRYVVFNASQIDGIPAIFETERTNNFQDYEKAESMAQALVSLTGLKMERGEPSYSPSQDTVRMPDKKSFDDEAHFYTVLLHECSHSTLHPCRMNRPEAIGRFGDATYGREELRAEISSALLAAVTGIPLSEKHIESHAAYLQSWIKALRDDKGEIFRACKDAQKICDYIVKTEADFTQGVAATAATAPKAVVEQSAIHEQPVTAYQAALVPTKPRGMSM
jgi:antirestriction protein ArdC